MINRKIFRPPQNHKCNKAANMRRGCAAMKQTMRSEGLDTWLAQGDFELNRTE